MNIEKIKEALKLRKISISELERKTNTRKGTISKILNGKTKYPRIDTLCKIIYALDIKISEIINVEEIVNERCENER